MQQNKVQLDISISEYLTENGSDATSVTTQLEHITSMTRTTERDQFCSTVNYIIFTGASTHLYKQHQSSAKQDLLGIQIT